MPRVKQTGRRTRMDPNALPMPPRLSQMPVERWLDDENERLAHDERLSGMEILPPKFIGDGVLPDEKYPEFWRLIDIQGLRPFLYIRERYYPCFVTAAYTTMFIRDNLNDEGNGGFVFGFKLGGRRYEFPLSTLATVWGLKDKGVTSRVVTTLMERGINSISWMQSEDSGATTEEEQPRLSFRGGSPHFVGYGSGETNPFAISDGAQDAQVLAGQGYYLALSVSPNSFLGHAHLWTRIFEIAPLDSTREDDVEPEISHAISSKNIHQMQRNLVGQADIAEDAGVDAMAGAQLRVEIGTSSQIPAETEVPPRFQPDIAEFVRKGFKDMRSMMTEGFARLSDRISRLNIHMASQDANLRSLRDEFRSFQGEDVYMDVQEQPGDAPMQD
ncbi:hypothetical protein PIB30_057578 [Stylosanthes scabra]|uniref:Uncharacterized protein n=1 Tax=Stylosanthes scabra TaxID=79078 RepID=A0ABU6RKA4_9FABA|nr:hypothetical protein [Stylosanthes scabra]